MLSIPDRKEYTFQFEETSDKILLEFGNEWDIVMLHAKDALVRLL